MTVKAQTGPGNPQPDADLIHALREVATLLELGENPDIGGVVRAGADRLEELVKGTMKAGSRS